MKTIPRICGAWWPACLALVVFLLLPLGAFAQEAGAGGDEGASGAAAEEPEAGEGALSPDPGEAVSDEIPEIEEPPIPPESEFNFVLPERFDVVDRRNDQGGAFALRWSDSESDEKVVGTDPETGEDIVEPGGQYMAFHSAEGADGPWEQIAVFPANTQYIWEAPASFGFFLSDENKGTNEHYAFFENTYPATGVYSYEIVPDEENPGSFLVNAFVYDEEMEDYSALTVYCNLRPLGGEKVQLEYVAPPEDGEGKPWENLFQVSAPLDTSDLLTTVSYYVLFTANVRGNKMVVLDVQPSEGDSGTTVVSSGSETEVPDNRDPHWFRLYVAPSGFELPEGEDLPPDAWLVGSVNEVVARANLWNVARTNTWLWAILVCSGVMFFITRARVGAALFVRRIAGLDHVEEAIGRATEMGRPILYSTGLGSVADIATIASMNILGQVARKVADYESRILVPNRDPIVMAVCQEVVQEAYIDAGRPDAFRKDDIFFLTDDQFAYTAAVDGIMMREKPATNFFMGMFFAESLLLAETGAGTGALQIAGTDALAQLPFFITACDYTLIGEELYAASAYLSKEPLLLGSLKGQDLAKAIFMIVAIAGTIWLCLGVGIKVLPLPNPEFFRQLFQVF